MGKPYLGVVREPAVDELLFILGTLHRLEMTAVYHAVYSLLLDHFLQLGPHHLSQLSDWLSLPLQLLLLLQLPLSGLLNPSKAPHSQLVLHRVKRVRLLIERTSYLLSHHHQHLTPGYKL